MRYTHLLLLAGALSVAACSGKDESQEAAQAAEPKSLLERERSQAESTLTADEALHEFGEIPIDGGDVTTTFTLTNSGQSRARVVAVYTSCGCTTAALEFTDGTTVGPFGMPGHGDMPELDRAIEPHESFRVQVTFDPAAHGPQGLGSIMRAVNVHTRDGGTTELRITAQVVRL
jgi:hypothetical protein